MVEIDVKNDFLLKNEAAPLTSLRYFRPQFMSLRKPHPLWLTRGSNPFEVNKAVTQGRMLSGRYHTDQLMRHWTSNEQGVCQLPLCTGSEVGSLEHILIFCQALQPIRNKMMKVAYEVSEENEYLQNIIHWVMSHPNRSIWVQFLLNCSCLPIVIESCHKWGPEIMERLFYISRNCCYSIHRTRMDMLKLPQFR